MAARVTLPAYAGRRNVVPGAYRGVAVTSVDCELDEPSLQRHFLGREAYRRTRFIVVRNGSRTAVVAVAKASEDPLFSPITELRLLVGPAECVYLQEPEVDTAIPTALAQAAVSPPWPGWSGPRPRCSPRAWSWVTSATGVAGRPSGWPCPRCAC